MGNTPCTERPGDVKGDEVSLMYCHCPIIFNVDSYSNFCAIIKRQDSGWLFNALDFCDRGTRSNCIFLSKRHYKILTTDASFRWRLERLHAEHGIYFPSALPKDKTWRSVFLELDKKRHLWEAEDLHDSNSLRIESGETYSISVFARFKPLNIDCDHIQNGRKAVLPLHQRLALIRISNGLDSNRDALCVLKEQGGWFKEKWDGIEDSSQSDDIAQNSQDNASDLLTSGIKMIDSKNSRVVVVDPTTGLREFEFDCVIEEQTPQEDVYEESTRGLVCDVINGVSATCLVYGQTGSGKTFTMFGTQESHFFDSNLVGIIPRACSELMSAVKFRRETLNLNIECTVSVSYKAVENCSKRFKQFCKTSLIFIRHTYTVPGELC